MWGEIKKEETKKVTVTAAPCQNIFSTGLTETRGLSGNKKKKKLASADRYRYQTDVRHKALYSEVSGEKHPHL